MPYIDRPSVNSALAAIASLPISGSTAVKSRASRKRLHASSDNETIGDPSFSLGP